MTTPESAFVNYLNNEGITCKNVNEGLTISKFVNNNFSLLNDKLLRKLVQLALAERDKNLSIGIANKDLLGIWGSVIDAVKEVTIERRDMAEKHFIQATQIGRSGQPKDVIMFLYKLFKAGHIDFLFLDVLNETINALKSKEDSEEAIAMYEFFKAVIEKAKNESIQDKTNNKPTTTTTTATTTNTNSTTSINEIESKVASINIKDISENNDKWLKNISENNDKKNDNNTEDDDDDDDDDDEDDEDDNNNDDDIDSDDEIEEYKKQMAEKEKQKKMDVIGFFVNDLIKSVPNHPPDELKEKLLAECSSGAMDANLVLLVLSEYIQACEAAGYANKIKLLDNWKSSIESYLNQRTASVTSRPYMPTTTHHAPQFVDANNNFSLSGEALDISSPDTFLDLSNSLSYLSTDKIKNAKKKSLKRELRKKAEAIGEKVGDHLAEHGFVVCDNFLPLDLVRRVRIESGLFKDYFEQSEIWVGKGADVGAHLSVPSVRGDKVLWMCGAHNTGGDVEGVNRTIRTMGEIEPCELKVKAAAPIRKFNALKELISSCNAIVEQLKSHVDNVKGVYERSDAMVAIYPGEGSRFAKHIDNTTRDGRRLTLLVYLNPNWTRDLGGALRLTPVSNPDPTLLPTADKSNKRIDVYPEAGRLLIFYSSIIHHEVLPTYGERLAITIWYYDEAERRDALLQAKEAGRSDNAGKASVEQQKEAKMFIADLMGGDAIGEDGGDPTQNELDILAEKVKQLTPEALSIVSSITGAPSTESFKEGFQLLSPSDLKSMRSLFRRMGLNN